ncbi:hypothetical protein BKA61DRAFT_570736 [Leptodontidium sp. MPI-SDFR-AT-0119]|nr:hypothetical protein BKA61DRAFT_570736 [Leptodontidium sp. MPI-SDFR-AT-0119]
MEESAFKKVTANVPIKTEDAREVGGSEITKWHDKLDTLKSKRSSNSASNENPPPAKKQKLFDPTYSPEENSFNFAGRSQKVPSNSNEKMLSTSGEATAESIVWGKGQKGEAEARDTPGSCSVQKGTMKTEANREHDTPLRLMAPKQVVEQFEKGQVDLKEPENYMVVRQSLSNVYGDPFSHSEQCKLQRICSSGVALEDTATIKFIKGLEGRLGGGGSASEETPVIENPTGAPGGFLADDLLAETRVEGMAVDLDTKTPVQDPQPKYLADQPEHHQERKHTSLAEALAEDFPRLGVVGRLSWEDLGTGMGIMNRFNSDMDNFFNQFPIPGKARSAEAIEVNVDEKSEAQMPIAIDHSDLSLEEDLAAKSEGGVDPIINVRILISSVIHH